MITRSRTAVVAVLVLVGWMASAATPAGAFGSSVPPPLPSVSAGGYMSCAVGADGFPACWGENGVPSNDVANTSPGGQATPPPGVRFLEVNAGYATACGVTVTQTLSCWGSGRFDKFRVPTGTFSHVAPGLNYICALRTDGSLACWGGEDPALDPGQLIVANMPTTGTFTQVTMGNRHACALRSDGQVLCWGVNAVQGGVSNGQTVVPPGTYTSVNSSNFDSCAIRTDGTAVCWGRGAFGQKTVPAGTFTQLSVGFGHVCGLRPDQTITCWGRNAEGETVVPAGTYTQVGSGTFHTCAMPTTGPPARCWGNNAAGRVQPVLGSLTPHAAYVANPYSLQLAMTTSLAPAPTFSLTSGSLPPGVTLSPTGQISGSPTTPGSYTFSVAASSLGLSPLDCANPTLVPDNDSLPCQPGDPTTPATATRSFTINVGAVAPAPGSITGVVTASTGGAPVAGVNVTITHSGGATAAQTTTDGTGSYRVDGLLPGTYSVRVGGQELQPQTKPAPVTEGAVTTVSFSLPPLVRPTVTGVSNNYFDTVTDGLFVEWSEVFEQRLDGPSAYTVHQQAGCADPPVATAFNGNWLEIRPRIRDLEMTGWQNVVPGGTYYLRVAPNTEFGLTSLQRNLLTCVQFVAQLRPADRATVAGSVRSGAAPIVGATVTVTRTLRQPGSVAGQATTDASGGYSIGSMAPGPYTVTVSAPGYPTQTRSVTLTGNVTTAATFTLGPSANDDVYTTAEDRPLTVAAPGVLANDTHATGATMTVGSATKPPKGTVVLNPNGSFVYTPDANANGIDTFTYIATDPNGNTDPATVTINVTPVNDPPVAVDDSYSTAEDTTLTVGQFDPQQFTFDRPGVLGNDSDVDGGPLFVVMAGDPAFNVPASKPANGTLVLRPNGSFLYTPNANFSGTDSFTYTVSDTSGATATATARITVTAVNDLPVAVADFYTTSEGGALTVPSPGVLGNDTDVEPGSLTAGSASDPPHGTVALNADGSFTYTPDGRFNGIDTFTYTASDAGGGTATATVTIAVGRTDGYRMVASDGGIFAFGDARFLGSTGGTPLNRPIVGMATTPSENGYWLVASDGGIFAYGDAGFFGSTGGKPLNRPIVGMAATPSGRGYWLVASDGGIFGFGDAAFFGSTGGTPLRRPVVGMAATPSGRGYWLVASDGGIFAYGDASFHGSAGGTPLAKPIVGIAPSSSGAGYLLVASDGGIFGFGDAKYFGSAGGAPLARPIVGMASMDSGDGYWLVASDGGIFAFGDAPFLGSTGGAPLNRPIVGMGGAG